ncbi:MAG: N-acetylglutaminylglutamine synthetase [Zoogloeaceae bacterium]|nr:N-acetylglutaminylglutamine synthetase [Zoogloeaceae bacterium]
MPAAQSAAPVNPLDPAQMLSLRHWDAQAGAPASQTGGEVVVDCGWGRLIFGQTFSDPKRLADTLQAEAPGRRDLALYLRDPQVVVSLAPQQLFIDPSFTYRLDLAITPAPASADNWRIRQAHADDAPEMIRIYRSRGMVSPLPGFFDKELDREHLDLLVAERRDGSLLGTVTGVDHRRIFNDPDNGSSLWALAVDVQADTPGVGEALVRALANLYRERQRSFLDLSVLYDNTDAITLYEKLGFVRVPVWCVKNKNPINEPLYTGPDTCSELNIYARILVQEARRRGIGVEVIDAEHGYFRLSLGGRSIVCRESLSEMTSAIAMSRCDDKRVTRRVLAAAGLRLPEQVEAGHGTAFLDFLKRHARVVVKPARGEQGRGVRVDIRDEENLIDAVEAARNFCETVIIEAFAEGDDLRIVVINHEVVAAAIRRPPEVAGNGKATLRELIERQSRRRARATGGESRIPLDRETESTLAAAGYTFDDVLPEGVSLRVRRTANLHTGGTIHDVTAELHPALADAAVVASRALDIPVVGLDFMVTAANQPNYLIIEANERPGLANHEPQPTAERFIDLLFPQTRSSQRTTETRHAI